MKNIVKGDEAYKTIGEVAKDLGLIDRKTGNLQTHTLRYWETQFKQIKPNIRAGNRRYYSKKNFNLIKNIQFLLKDKGLTINGVKKILNSNETLSSIDGKTNLGLYKPNLKTAKDKIKKIKKIVAELKEFK
tara:strand:- start:283 stop:675 length:393 start_codon:yes stop_codon:yes gene_type:complete